MAYHYMRNRFNGIERTIRTETLPSYTWPGTPWLAFDTEAERGTAPPLLNRAFVLNMESPLTIIGMKDQDTYATLSAYLTAQDTARDGGGKPRFGFFETEEALQAVLASRVWLLDLQNLEIHATLETGHNPETHTAFPSAETARAHAETLYLWAVDQGSGEAYKIPPGDARNTGYSRENRYLVAPTKAEALAKLAPRYVWNALARKYVLWSAAMTRPRASGFAITRAVLRDAARGNGDVIDIKDQIARLTRHKVLGRIGRALLQAKTVIRLNANITAMALAGGTLSARHIIETCSCGDLVLGRGTGGMCYGCREAEPEEEESEYDEVECPSCEGDFTPNDNSYRDTEGDYYCSRCRDERPRRPGTPSGQLMAYSTDALKALPRKFLLGEGEPKSLCPTWLGWELEVHAKQGMVQAQSIKAIQELSQGWAICKSDGSLQGTGFEIVSIPASLRWHRDNALAFLAKAAAYVEGWQHADCGMHVHIGKEELSPLTQGKLLVFMHEKENQPFISALAGRDPTSYCLRGERKKTIPDYAREAGLGRYQSLNFATRGQKTVEMRIFRSNVGAGGFVKNLELTHALVEWCKLASPFELARLPKGVRQDEKQMESIPRDGWRNFVAWCGAHCADYPYLVKWLKEHGYLPGGRGIISPSIAA